MEKPDAVVEKIIETPMDNEAINKYLPDCKIWTNKEITRFNKIEQLFPHWNNFSDSVVILFLDSPNSGHWTGLTKMGDGGKDTVIEFFDSYGNPPDKVYKFVPDQIRTQLGTGTNHLTKLLKQCPYQVAYNPIDYQKGNSSNSEVNTCGRHVCFRIIKQKGNGYTLPEYYDYMKGAKKHFKENYDTIVSQLIDLS